MEILKIFALLSLFIIGIILFIHNRKFEQELEDKVVPQKIRNANSGILVLSVLLIMVPMSIFVCKKSCTEIKTHALFDSNLLYSLIIAAIGITIIVLGIILSSTQYDVESNARVIWSSGIGVLILSFLFSDYSCKVFGSCKLE